MSGSEFIPVKRSEKKRADLYIMVTSYDLHKGQSERDIKSLLADNIKEQLALTKQEVYEKFNQGLTKLQDVVVSESQCQWRFHFRCKPKIIERINLDAPIIMNSAKIMFYDNENFRTDYKSSAQNTAVSVRREQVVAPRGTRVSNDSQDDRRQGSAIHSQGSTSSRTQGSVVKSRQQQASVEVVQKNQQQPPSNENQNNTNNAVNNTNNSNNNSINNNNNGGSSNSISTSASSKQQAAVTVTKSTSTASKTSRATNESVKQQQQSTESSSKKQSSDQKNQKQSNSKGVQQSKKTESNDSSDVRVQALLKVINSAQGGHSRVIKILNSKRQGMEKENGQGAWDGLADNSSTVPQRSVEWAYNKASKSLFLNTELVNQDEIDEQPDGKKIEPSKQKEMVYLQEQIKIVELDIRRLQLENQLLADNQLAQRQQYEEVLSQLLRYSTYIQSVLEQ